MLRNPRHLFVKRDILMSFPKRTNNTFVEDILMFYISKVEELVLLGVLQLPSALIWFDNRILVDLVGGMYWLEAKDYFKI